MKRRILIVEDESHLAEGLRVNLELDGYEPLVAYSGEEALDLYRRGGVELVILDVMLPGMDGFEVCRQLRAGGDRVPILFLTARDRDEDRVRGLEQGGDDYLTKPFNLRELVARIKGIFRREDWYRARPARDLLVIGDSRVDLGRFEAETAQGRVSLKEKEAMILRLLADHEGEPVSRQDIIDRVWGYDAFPSLRTVDNFILGLRKLLERDPSRPRHLLTVHGRGYRLVLAGAPAAGQERAGTPPNDAPE